MTWILVAALCAAPIAPHRAHAQGAPGGSAPAVSVAFLERLFDALAAVAAEIPRETFDPEAIVAMVGPDPLALLAWVRDETNLVPYRGALRGPVGVLMDRRGNSLDRALLLADLLERAGHDARLVQATLDDVEASRLLDALAARPSRPAAPADDTWSRIERHARTFDLDVDALRAAYAASRASDEAMRAEMARRVDAHTAFLLEAVGAPTPDRQAESAAHALDVSDHWWVQVSISGAWLDLDPSLPGDSVGETITGAGATTTTAGLADLPAALQHSFRIRVVLECAQGSGSVDHLLVESPAILPANTAGEQIVVQYVPVGWVDDPEAAEGAAEDRARFLAAVGDQGSWFPVISIGDTSHYDQAFSSECAITPAVLPLPGAAAAGAFDVAGGLFDTFGTPAEPSTGDAHEPLRTLWLEYEVATPGSGVTLTRRAVFDRSAGATANGDADGLAWRLALLGETSVLPLFAQLPADYVEHLGAERLLRHRANIVLMAADPAAEGTPEPFATTDLEVLALARSDEFGGPGIGANGPVFLRSLNVLTRHVQLALDATGAPTLVQAFDIVANDVGTGPTTGDTFAARVRQGVTDTNAEALVGLSACRSGDPQRIVCREAGGAAEAFEATHETTPWIVVRSSADAALLAAWPIEARSMALADVAAGYVVVAPPLPFSADGSPFASWWRVDPTSGATLGMGENGWGASLVEYARVLTVSYLACGIGAVVSGSGAGRSRCLIFGLGMAAGAPLKGAAWLFVVLAAGGAGAE